ncbi:UDP-glucuronosyltransferase 2A1-like [Brachyhypopomus gauderio]|uniref:UDP-glucuronosyltransferase 2A1-like n=1 Tax=Brachyhypopomus gauderio TaxID=698409 RepID=UPI004042E006
MVYSYFLPLIVFLLSVSEITLGKVLVLPGEYSHWHNMRTIVEELVDRNHSVTVLVLSASTTVKHAEKERFEYVVFNVNMGQEEMQTVWQNFISVSNQDTTGFQKLFILWKIMSGFVNYIDDVCDGMLLDKKLVTSLTDSHYDVILYDPMIPCSDLMAETLGVPRVMSFRFSFAFSVERLCGQMPAPPSYVPAVAAHGHLTDHMDFIERLENVLLYIAHTAIFRLLRV